MKMHVSGGGGGISCFKGRVKESICGEKLTNGNSCVSDCNCGAFEGLTAQFLGVCVER